MARPQVFISSTFYDLRHVRTSLDTFVEQLGYEPIISEKGKIAYDPDIPLDESCYRGAASCDIFVLIIGGRYGSPISEESVESSPEFYDRYTSITKNEYEAANENEIPTYILVERSVFSEYETFKRNKSNSDVEYAHVDSVNVFYFLDDILAKRKNNPLQQFDRHSEIETWLREQWAGLFQELISRRNENKKIVSLSNRVDELAVINNSLKRYMEAIISRVSPTPEDAEGVISSEKIKIDDEKRIRDFQNSIIVMNLLSYEDVKTEDVLELNKNAKSIEDLARSIEVLIKNEPGSIVKYWISRGEDILELVNEARELIDLPPLYFENKL